MKKLFALSALMVVAATTPVMANDPAKKEAMVNKYFTKADTNSDGKISEDEHEALANKKFDEADTNNDSYLTMEESKAFHKKEWQEWKDKKGSKDMSKAANANPTEHSANSTNPSQQ